MPTTTTIRFEDDDYEWLLDEKRRRRMSMAKIIAELIDYARNLEQRGEPDSGRWVKERRDGIETPWVRIGGDR